MAMAENPKLLHQQGEGQRDPLALAVLSLLVGAVVRAPITGITLVIELTGSSELLLPMLVAAFAAMTVATVLKEPPIYDSLRVSR
jgi:chloride channel protein, CIC family